MLELFRYNTVGINWIDLKCRSQNSMGGVLKSKVHLAPFLLLDFLTMHLGPVVCIGPWFLEVYLNLNYRSTLWCCLNHFFALVSAIKVWLKPEIDENGRRSDFFPLTQLRRPIAEMIVLNPSTTIVHQCNGLLNQYWQSLCSQTSSKTGSNRHFPLLQSYCHQRHMVATCYIVYAVRQPCCQCN